MDIKITLSLSYRPKESKVNQEKRLEHTASNQLQNVDSILPYKYSAHPFIAFFFLPLRFSFLLSFILRFLDTFRASLPSNPPLLLVTSAPGVADSVSLGPLSSARFPSFLSPQTLPAYSLLRHIIFGTAKCNRREIREKIKKHREDKTTKVAGEILLLHHLALF